MLSGLLLNFLYWKQHAPPMSLSLSQILALLLCWLAYAVLHSLLASLLASLSLKRAVAARWPRLAPGYRLAFNVLAVVLLVPPLWLTMKPEAFTRWPVLGIVMSNVTRSVSFCALQ